MSVFYLILECDCNLKANSRPAAMARGSQEAGITQPSDHLMPISLISK